MSAAEFLDRLDAAQANATPGLWKLWGMDVMADQDGTANYDTAVPVAHTYFRDENGKPRTWDASLICEMQRALPKLTAALRAVEALAERFGWDTMREPDWTGQAVAAAIRATIADALAGES